MLAYSFKPKNPAKPKAVSAAIRYTFSTKSIDNTFNNVSINGLLLANWKAPFSLGTLDHASAAGVVQMILGSLSGVKECSHLRAA